MSNVLTFDLNKNLPQTDKALKKVISLLKDEGILFEKEGAVCEDILLIAVISNEEKENVVVSSTLSAAKGIFFMEHAKKLILGDY